MRVNGNGFKERVAIMERLLVANWLRPESALCYAHLLCGARRLLGTSWRKPSLEFGCMDGVNTAVLLGAEFKDSFDVYEDTRWDRDSHTRSTLKDDYFNVVRRQNSGVSFKKKPRDTVTYGIDWKEAHVTKSKRLGIFGEILRINPSQPVLSMGDNTVATIWAPGIYWMDHLEKVLSELNRVLIPGGRMVTIVPDRSQLDLMLHRYSNSADPAWIRDLDRGRHENASRQARLEQEWKNLFRNMGFKVSYHETAVPEVIIKTYEVGFRPMFPVFLNMYEKLKTLTPQGWLDVKRHWIEAVTYFLKPLCDTSWMSGMPRCWHVFELSKR